MKILFISDEESKYYWDYYSPDKLEDIDLIISCGDLAPQYLSFLVTLSHVPVLYIHGNHDECYLSTPPEGCVCIDDDLIVYNGIRIMGLGGSMRYRPGTFQFTERQMRRRYTKLKRKLFLKGGVDILVCHTGFSVFKEIMTKYKPKYFVHGHVHKAYGHEFKRYDKFGNTIIVNACERCVINYEK